MGRAARKISQEILDVAMQKFNEMPEKIGAAALPLNDAFLLLKPAISEMQKKGYSLIEILELLKQSGINVGMTTLKTVVSKTRKKRAAVIQKPAKTEAKPAPQKPTINKTPAVQDPDEK